MSRQKLVGKMGAQGFKKGRAPAKVGEVRHGLRRVK